MKTEITKQSEPFVLYGIRERIAFQEWINPKSEIKTIKESKCDSYTKWDVCFLSASTFFLTEIKVRDRFFNEYGLRSRNVIIEKDKHPTNPEGWDLEKTKYDELIKLTSSDKAKENGTIPLFIVFFKNKLVGWNLNTIDVNRFAWKIRRKASVNGSPKKGYKKIAELYLDEAMFIEDLKINKDELTLKAAVEFNKLFIVINDTSNETKL